MNENTHDAGGQSADKTAVEGPAASTCSAFSIPSKFMTSMREFPEIAEMTTLELAQRTSYEIWNNGACNWDDEHPEKCWYRAIGIELGQRIAHMLVPEEWGDWQDNVVCWLTGIAGYDDHNAFNAGAGFGVSVEDWDALEAFLLQND